MSYSQRIGAFRTRRLLLSISSTLWSITTRPTGTQKLHSQCPSFAKRGLTQGHCLGRTTSSAVGDNDSSPESAAYAPNANYADALASRGGYYEYGQADVDMGVA